MTARVPIQPQYIHNGSSANGVGTTIPCSGYEHVLIEISTTNNANLKLLAQGAIGRGKLGENAPDFSSPSVGGNDSTVGINTWSYIEQVNYNDGSAIDGSTGITYSGTDSTKILEYNINGLDFINFEIASYVAGNVYIRARLYNNN